MDEKHRKEAERIYGRKADSTYVPKPKYPPPNNGLGDLILLYYKFNEHRQKIVFFVC